jgi:hypothetical protein
MLVSAREAGPKQRQAILDYIAAANGIPPEKVTEIRALLDQGKIDEANAVLADASKARTATITADADTAKANDDLDAVAEKERIAKISAIFTGGLGDLSSMFSTAPKKAAGGPIPGSPSQAVPIVAHGGEYVLSADVVAAIKNGRQSRGLGGRTQSAVPPNNENGEHETMVHNCKATIL